MKISDPYQEFCGKVLLRILALLIVMGAAMPALAGNQNNAQPACWFYKYQWVFYRMIPNTWPPTTFPTGGAGTGLMVTDGRPPNPMETAAIVTGIEKSLPRGDLQAPPPQAFIKSMSRTACPHEVEGMSLPLAKIWLKQPDVPAGSDGQTGKAASPRGN